MTDPFEVLSSERGVVRIFTSDFDAEGNAAITPANVQKLLGTNLDLDASRVEIFPSTVIETIGLSTYLQEGYGIPEEDLTGTAAALDRLKGLVILVASGAFNGKSVTLEPKTGIRYVGSFKEPSPAPPVQMAAMKAATGSLDAKGVSRTSNERTVRPWPIILLALVAAAALVLFFAI